MVGLVLVSHSAKLAEGVRELAQQMTQGRVPIAVAGGIDDEDNPIGTDPMKVCAAVEAVYSPEGVIVLMDLGSALMSAETALEFLEPGWQSNIYLCDAPFVEGAISAAIQASVSSPVDVIIAEARASLRAKQQHLSPIPDDHQIPSAHPDALGETAHSIRVIVPNTLGIHARPAARLVSVAGRYAAKLTIQKGSQLASAHSINQVTLLDVRQGDELLFIAEGIDAENVLRAVQDLVDDNFGDREDSVQPQRENQKRPDDVIGGIGASKGLAIGQVYLINALHPNIQTVTTDDAEGEQRRFNRAVEAAIHELKQLVQRSMQRADAGEAAIFDAHSMVLQDDDLLSRVQRSIAQERNSAESAWWAAIEAMAARYRQSNNEYLQARATDIFDVGKRVLRQLSPDYADTLEVKVGSILAAPDLTPSQIAQLDPDKVLGVVTQHGGATSHSAIIARSLGIPAVVGLGADYCALSEGQTIIVDGDKGWVYIRPTADQIAASRQAVKRQRALQKRLLRDSQQRAVTPDNRAIEVAANIGKVSDTAGLLTIGAEGVGVFRTEILFMNRHHAPDEQEQYEAYTAAAKNLGSYSLIVRTLDVGGDKTIDYLQGNPEENPFLGYRGIRNWLDNVELAHTQLRAICRASAHHNIKVMFPMVGTLDEVQRAKQHLRDVHEQLSAQSVEYAPDMEVGIMIEVPSAVLIASQLADHVNFFSIGTNDLTQYIMAADRGNARVNHLATPFQPALIRAIKQVVDAAHAKGKWVGICGEMAGNPLLTPLLLGLELDELSMNAPSIPEVKAIIRQTSYEQAKALAAHILTLETSAQVEACLMGREPG